MKILSIDPSSTELGWAVLDTKDFLLASGVISTKAVTYGERFQFIDTSLTQIIGLFKPDEVACERAIRFKGRRIPALEVAVKTIEHWAKRHKLQIRLYSPGEWKHSVLGNGNATKADVAWLMAQHFPSLGPDTSEHIWDALAIGLHRAGVARLESMAQKGGIDDKKIAHLQGSTQIMQSLPGTSIARYHCKRACRLR